MYPGIAEWLRHFKINLFAFASAHNSYYDLLEDGQCVMLIPLMALEEIANWKEGEGYEALVCCNSKKAQFSLGKWGDEDNLDHLKWEQKGDAELATVVLKAYVKALADSLDNNWEEYFDGLESDHHEFEQKKSQMNAAKDVLRGNGCKVEVPELKKMPLLFRKKFFKIDLGELYGKDKRLVPLIPDPSLLGFKAAVNWSGRFPETRKKKLLSCCSSIVDTDDESLYSRLPSNISFSSAIAKFKGEVDVEQSARDYEKQLEADLLNREVAFPNFISDSEAGDSDSDLSSVGWQGRSGAVVSEGSTF